MVTTRKRAAKTDQSGDDNKEQPKADDKSKKRKRRESSSADKTDEEVDVEAKHETSRVRLNKEAEEEDNVTAQESAHEEPIVCSCRHDVMRCIGILPSLPIMDEYYDSDDSDSDFEESRHTVLPIVERSSNKQQQHDH